MKLGILILKDEDKFDDLLSKLKENKFLNITAFNSNSYIVEKGKKIKKNTNILASIRNMVDYYNDESKTILIPCEDNKIDELKNTIKEVIQEEHLILFILPIDDVWGL